MSLLYHKKYGVNNSFKQCLLEKLGNKVLCIGLFEKTEALWYTLYYKRSNTYFVCVLFFIKQFNRDSI